MELQPRIRRVHLEIERRHFGGLLLDTLEFRKALGERVRYSEMHYASVLQAAETQTHAKRLPIVTNLAVVAAIRPGYSLDDAREGNPMVNLQTQRRLSPVQ